MTQKPPYLILASKSPRRSQLLAAAGYEFNVQPASDSAESGIWCRETPSELVARLAHQKAGDVAKRIENGIVLGCDTVAECCGHILGKPKNIRHARGMLRLLRGREHHVYSGVCLWRRPDNQTLIKVEVTRLKMDEIELEKIEAYLEGGQWEGKSGAFGFQDGLDWMHILAGSESNVVGLPMELLEVMLKEFAF